MRNIEQDVLLRVSLVLTVIVAVLPVWAQQEAPAVVPSEREVYAVKFLCGSLRPAATPASNGVEWPVKPGNYLTAINVHNPNSFFTVVRKKAVLLYRADKVLPHETTQGPVKPLMAVELKPDWGFEIDCPDIRTVLLNGTVPAPTFIKGWVIIEVWPTPGTTAIAPLDVTAVYTAHGWRKSGTTWVYDGFAEDVEAVLPKRVK